MADKHWKKASQSVGETNCVELASTLEEIRDSKNPTATLTVSRAAVDAFLASLT